MMLACGGGCGGWPQGHDGAVRCAAVSSDARIIVSGSDDASVRVWDAASGACGACLKVWAACTRTRHSHTHTCTRGHAHDSCGQPETACQCMHVPASAMCCIHSCVLLTLPCSHPSHAGPRCCRAVCGAVGGRRGHCQRLQGRRAEAMGRRQLHAHGDAAGGGERR